MKKIIISFFLVVVSITSLTAQKKQSISFSYDAPTNTDGLHFDVEMDYIANIYGGPEFRVAIKSVEINGITFKGEYYDKNNSSLKFPNSKNVKGDLYLGGTITRSIYWSTFFENCNISIELSKSSTTANSLQDGGSAYFSEAITDICFINKKEELEGIKADENWKSKWLNNTSITNVTIEKYQDLHIKGGVRIEEDLQNQINGNGNYGAATLKKYTHIGKSSKYYEEGIAKANELYKKASTESLKNSIEANLNKIIANRDEAVEGEAAVYEVEAKAKIEENKRLMEETRLNEKKLARINQQIAYNNKVKSFTNKGIATQQAHKMAQNEYKIQLIDNVVGTGLNQISNAIMSGINRSYEKKEARRQEMYSYNSNLRNYAETLKKTNKEYVKQLNNDMPFFKNSSDNIADIKQEILWIIENLGNSKFAYQNKHVYGQSNFDFGGGIAGTEDIAHKATVIVAQKIEDVYFKGNTLHIKFRHIAKEATFDKSHQMGMKKKYTWQPSKFELTTVVAYDIENNIKNISRKSYWNGRGSLPSNGYLSSKDFLNQIKLLDGNIYAKPFGSSGNEGVKWSEKNNFGLVLSDTWVLNTKFSKFKELIIKKEIETNQANPNFTKAFTQSVKNDLKNYWKILGGKPSIIQNTTKLTSNPNEISVISIWEDKYMILTFPGKKIFEQLNPKSIKNINGSLNPKNNKATVSAKTSNYAENFRLSYFSDQESIGGNSGEELLLTGSHQQIIDELIYSFFVNNDLVKDTRVYDKFNPDIWNPYIEVGTFEKLVEYDYINDPEIKKSIEKWGFKNISVYNFRSKPEGIYLKFRPKVLAMLLPVGINKYQFQNKVKGTYQMSGQKTKGEFLHYKPRESKPGIALMLYKKQESDVYYRNIKQYEPLEAVSPLYYSYQFLNADYNYLQKDDIGSVKYNPFDFKGMGSRMQNYYKMFKELSSMDFSVNAIKYNGKTPAFYSNGKVKTLGAKVNGKPSGIWEYYSQEGVLEKKVHYRGGYLHTISLVQKYNINGNVILAEEFDPYGILRSSEYYDYKTEIKRETYYEDGIKYEDFLYKAKSIYDKNAVLFESHTYEDGILIKTTKH